MIIIIKYKDSWAERSEKAPAVPRPTLDNDVGATKSHSRKTPYACPFSPLSLLPSSRLYFEIFMKALSWFFNVFKKQNIKVCLAKYVFKKHKKIVKLLLNYVFSHPFTFN